ncbi:hypothetical protein, partial [Acinetobacter cumulans]|uniref:hypothetical protein n=1 Tax=Acinetobacter cumulans TaxID=2136182 RepID=UPI001C098A72
KIGFGDLILLSRYFFNQQMSTDPNSSHKSRWFVNPMCNFFTQFRQIMLFYLLKKNSARIIFFDFL